MGLFLHFLGRPSPRSRSADIADHGLPTIGNVDMLDRHLLLAHRTIVLEGRDLSGERARELVEGVLSAVLLRDNVNVGENGFDLATEDGGETSFYPARLNAVGKVEDDEGMKDVVAPYLNDLAACRPVPTGVYLCIAEHAGKEVPIRQIPIVAKRGRHLGNAVFKRRRVRPEGGGETARVDVVGPIPLKAHLDQFSQEGREHCARARGARCRTGYMPSLAKACLARYTEIQRNFLLVTFPSIC